MRRLAIAAVAVAVAGIGGCTTSINHCRRACAYRGLELKAMIENGPGSTGGCLCMLPGEQPPAIPATSDSARFWVAPIGKVCPIFGENTTSLYAGYEECKKQFPNEGCEGRNTNTSVLPSCSAAGEATPPATKTAPPP